MRVISQYTNYVIQIRPQRQRPLGDGTIEVTQEPIYADLHPRRTGRRSCTRTRRTRRETALQLPRASPSTRTRPPPPTPTTGSRVFDTDEEAEREGLGRGDEAAGRGRRSSARRSPPRTRSCSCRRSPSPRPSRTTTPTRATPDDSSSCWSSRATTWSASSTTSALRPQPPRDHRGAGGGGRGLEGGVRSRHEHIWTPSASESAVVLDVEPSPDQGLRHPGRSPLHRLDDHPHRRGGGARCGRGTSAPAAWRAWERPLPRRTRSTARVCRFPMRSCSASSWSGTSWGAIRRSCQAFPWSASWSIWRAAPQAKELMTVPKE